jgi:hypothetical protein
MAKIGLRNGTPAQKTNATASDLIREMNSQSSSQKRMAQACRLNLAVDGNRNGRPFTMVNINGTTVKRYL